jgi:hypothetical protein
LKENIQILQKEKDEYFSFINHHIKTENEFTQNQE